MQAVDSGGVACSSERVRGSGERAERYSVSSRRGAQGTRGEGQLITSFDDTRSVLKYRVRLKMAQRLNVITQ